MRRERGRCQNLVRGNDVINPTTQFGNGACGTTPCSWECTSIISARECVALATVAQSPPEPSQAPVRVPIATLPRPVPPARPVRTYLVGIEGSPLTKIGMTTSTLGDRIAQLQTGQPFKLLPLLDLEGDYERALHRRFADQRVRGEWFDLSPLGDPADVVRSAVDEMTRPIERSGIPRPAGAAE
ncbi:GIY-YIG nuclease family protein [Streptomyces hydrogenans]|uniref:Bacteriophage T5 Orf172 DNA-binding domain-containing protein n=1 Tax=Streptomyces hydrogenans TaxID=1873719 RepID=A0ABQ3PP05_9ACTN|nr:GIY-YIG nuclease family protein [Streptomyces hydrogenans]GHG04518.1 hypothetical protein GCM10018784_15950 [Streptomyces hydrogenans]GHI26760.1 hypothetical protein Shyd_81310 [Streptomyces hydrogenans]